MKNILFRFILLAGYVTMSAFAQRIDLSRTQGTLPCARMPAMSGKMTSPQGSCALSDPTDVKYYGAKGDGVVSRTGVSISSGLTALTCTSCTFTAADVGKQIVVPGAAAAGAILKTTISTFTDATHVVLAAAAGTTVSAGIDMYYGSDDAANIQAAINALPAGSTAIGGGGVLFFPPGNYLVTSTINFVNNNVRITTANQSSTVLYPAGGLTSAIWKYSQDGTTIRYVKTENLTANCSSWPNVDGFLLAGIIHSQFYDMGAIFCRYGMATGGTTGNNYSLTWNGGVFNHNAYGINDTGQQNANAWTFIGTTLAVNSSVGLNFNGTVLNMSGVDVETNGYGVLLNDTSPSGAMSAIDIQGYFEANTTAHIRIGTAGATGRVNGVSIHGSLFNGAGTTTYGVYCLNGDSVKVANSQFANNVTNTMFGLVDGANQGCDNVSWENNTVVGTGTLALSGSNNTRLINGVLSTQSNANSYFMNVGYNNSTFPAVANRLILGGVTIPSPGLPAVSKLAFHVTTLDNTNNSDVCLYTKAGVLAAHIGAQHLGSTGPITATISGGPVAIAAGPYYAGFTSVGATLVMSQAASTQSTFYSMVNTTIVTTGGACPATITPPADSWVFTTGQTLSFGLAP